jgi:hypothetical protein
MTFGAFQANAFQNNAFQIGEGQPGAGKRYLWPTDFLPEPAWEEKPRKAKPFRPVWDRDPEFKQRNPDAPPRRELPPLPTSLLAPASQAVSSALPKFAEYGVPNALGMKARLQQAKEESEATEALHALLSSRGLLQDQKPPARVARSQPALKMPPSQIFSKGSPIFLRQSKDEDEAREALRTLGFIKE